MGGIILEIKCKVLATDNTYRRTMSESKGKRLRNRKKCQAFATSRVMIIIRLVAKASRLKKSNRVLSCIGITSGFKTRHHSLYYLNTLTNNSSRGLLL